MPSPESDRPAAGDRVATALAVGFCALHGLAIWIGMGGRDDLFGRWPLAIHDHPLYLHSALVTRAFLAQSGTTAGYDPSFMAGYAKSVVFPSSSTLPELVIAAAGRSEPFVVYKLYVLAAAALVPWLVLLSAWILGVGGRAIAAAVGLFLVYVWTDFPINYAAFGMLPYLLAIPLGLVAASALARYLDRGGLRRWLLATALGSLALLVHLTTALILVPAAALTHLVSSAGRRRPRFIRDLGYLLIPIVVLAVNAFWWLPGVWLAATKGASDFVLRNSDEPVGGRLLKIATAEPAIQGVLVALMVPGLIVLARRDRAAAAMLGGFAASGFAWGYLAAWTPRLDFLQPGRQTFAFYTAGTLLAGIALEEFASRLRHGPGRLDRWASLALILVAVRGFGPPLAGSVRARLGLDGGRPFLSSRPTERLRWIVDRVRAHVRPGERLLYEEAGFALPGVPDPFQDGRYSGLLPHLVPGIELLGGPYLHASLETNATQFGEGRLFGKADWDRRDFERGARLYRPSAIVCWSPRALRFCRENPDLIEVKDSQAIDLAAFDPRSGRWLRSRSEVLIGRVVGFGGMTIRGKAEVRAEPGKLHVRGASADLDGWVVLRYHSVPCLRSRPTVRLEPLRLGDDPVPFIGLRSPPESLTLELNFPP